jgi:hypothetical protein
MTDSFQAPVQCRHIFLQMQRGYYGPVYGEAVRVGVGEAGDDNVSSQQMGGEVIAGREYKYREVMGIVHRGAGAEAQQAGDVLLQ